jgi:sulfur-oxidizing protein SoxY
MPAKTLIAALAVALAMAPAAADERPAGPLEPSQSWETLRPNVVGDAAIEDAGELYALAAPFRAHDAATVPIRFTQAEGAPDVARLTIVIDENPAPVAATFEFGPAMQPIDLELRVRVDAYTNVRAIVETTDGARYMTGGFVRAAGGCSAPAAKDAAEAMAALGEMRLRWFDAEAPAQSGIRREAQVMLRHPNYSGLQRDQLTQLFIPPHFVDSLEVRQGEELLFSMTGGISISEDPAFRFAYTETGAGLTVTATDTKGARFEQDFPVGM